MNRRINAAIRNNEYAATSHLKRSGAIKILSNRPYSVAF